MNSQKRRKMPVEDRAKQFMPFDALKGFREALAEKEKLVEEKKSAERAELTEEEL